jgi:hypothetical protein
MDTINLHRPGARTVPLWRVVIQPSANGPVVLKVIGHTMSDAMMVAEEWLAATSITKPLFESVTLIGEVVAHDHNGTPLLGSEA